MWPRRGEFIATLLASLALAVSLAGCAAVSETTAPLTARAVLARAQAAAFTDMTCAVTIEVPKSSGLSNLTGTCLYTRHPARVSFTLLTAFLDESETFELIGDRATQTEYKRQTVVDFPKGAFAKAPLASHLFLDDLYQQFVSATLAGSATINGHAAYHLHNALTGEDAWIRTDNFYPARLRVQTDLGGVSGSVATLTFTKWDSGATIALPAA